MSKIKRNLFLMLVCLMLFNLPLIVLAQDNPNSRFASNFPQIRYQQTGETADGYIYITNVRRSQPRDQPNRPDANIASFLLVMDNQGRRVFNQRLPQLFAYNFGRTPNGNLYYYQLTDRGYGNGDAVNGFYRVMDEQGRALADYRARGVLPNTSLHEFVPLGNGNALVISQPIREMDLRAYGGSENALVIGAAVQEVSPRGEVIFEWQSWDDYPVGMTIRQDALTNQPPEVVPYIHANGVAVDLDGNILVSLRWFDEIVKIDRTTGEVIWRMGGGQSPFNEFTFIGDPQGGFSGQHHPTILENGNLLLFDNGNNHNLKVSRAVEYELDQVNKTARLVWSYTDGRFAPTLGSAQRLENGNTLIGWGSAPPSGPNVTEVDAGGNSVYEMWLHPSQMSYRVYRFPFGETENTSINED